MTRLTVALIALALAVLGLAACGGDDDEESSTPATTETAPAGGDAGGGGGGALAIEADPDGALAYTETSLSAPAGETTVEFDNPSSTGHDVVIEDGDGNEVARTDVISGDTTTADASFETGEYTYYCSVDGHQAAGMEGTLTVD